jgi:hypothetical protein
MEFTCQNAATLDSSHYNTVTFESVMGATAYNIYCRTPGAEQLCATVPATGAFGDPYSWVDSGSVTPSGALPTANTTGRFVGGTLNPDYSWTQNLDVGGDGHAYFQHLQVGGGTVLSAINLYSTASITPTVVSASSCSDQTFSVSGLAAADNVSSVTPPSALGNLSLNAYATAAGTILLHFCNPSASPVTPPAGVYSFLAVH